MVVVVVVVVAPAGMTTTVAKSDAAAAAGLALALSLRARDAALRSEVCSRQYQSTILPSLMPVAIAFSVACTASAVTVLSTAWWSRVEEIGCVVVWCGVVWLWLWCGCGVVRCGVV